MSTRYAAAFMPGRAPLRMAAQTFSRVAVSRAMDAPLRPSEVIWRLSAFLPALALTVMLCLSIRRYLNLGDVALLEGAVLALVGLTFVWLAFSVNTVCLGLIRIAFFRARRPQTPLGTDGAGVEIALLIPVYNETPWDVFGNASAMLKELTAAADPNRYSLFILSDTRDPDIAALEERAFAALQAERIPGAAVHYRRRAENTDKKVGNITDWIENWGGAYEAMVVLDADSLMSGAAIRQLVRALAADPDAGLIQSRPMLIGAQTLFGRVQQFSSSVYGWLLAEGLASWSYREGNYWGHNAIIRTRAFAESARLPYLRSLRGRESLILSHDFVEAGMLRRAGWAVRFLPQVGGSYEETPQTLIDYALRDRRWCHGNMQHLRLLATRGFHVISRMHLLMGALAFLMSPAWLAVVISWSLVGMAAETPTAYFSTTNPLHPIWPETTQEAGWIYLALVYGMLLFPKVMGALLFGMRRRTRVAYGSRLTFVGSTVLELLLSVLYAPIMMVQHTIATVFALTGRTPAWSPQNRGGEGYGWLETLRFHKLETGLGLVLIWGMVAANVSILILPIAVSFVLAVPLSKLSAWQVSQAALPMLRLDTPHTLIEPRIVSAARAERAWIKAALTQPLPAEAIPAE